jgi:type II secretory pathway component PulJ
MKNTPQHPRRCAGFTLVELIVGIALSVIVMFAVTSLLANTIGAHRANLGMTHLNQELRATMSMLTRELIRGGNWASAAEVALVTSNTDLILDGTSGTVTARAKVPGETGSSSADIPDHFGTDNAFGTNNSPLYPHTLLATKLNGRTLKYVDTDGAGVATVYTATITYIDPDELQLALASTFPTNTLPANKWSILNPFSVVTLADGTDTGTAADDCLLVNYDRPDTGTKGVLDGNSGDSVGFRYDETNKTIEIRQAGAGCQAGGWVDLTDDATIEITAFNITDVSPAPIVGVPAGYQLDMHEYQITVAGRLKSNTSVQRTLQETIKIRNNQVQ